MPSEARDSTSDCATALEKPEYWLIELSTEGDSEELEGLIVSADERDFAGHFVHSVR